MEGDVFNNYKDVEIEKEKLLSSIRNKEIEFDAFHRRLMFLESEKIRIEGELLNDYATR